jgi:hypothetical protein
MEQQLTAEPAVQAAETAPPSGRMLEQWADNAPMRHIPPLQWMIGKVDVDLRQRVTKLTQPLIALPGDDPRRASIEAEILQICKAADRVAAAVRPSSRQTLQPPDLIGRAGAALSQAVTCLRTLESTPFGRRYPYQTGDRSKAEPVYGALLALIYRVEQLLPLCRAVDPDTDRRLLAGLVTLTIPDDERLKQPMA